MTQKEVIEVIPGDEIKLGAHYKAGPEGDSADHIVIPSLNVLFDEDVIMIEWGERKPFSEHMRTLRTDNLPRSIVTENEWFHIAQERFIYRKVAPEQHEDLLVELGKRTYRKGLTHDDADRLKNRGIQTLVRAVGKERAAKIVEQRIHDFLGENQLS